MRVKCTALNYNVSTVGLGEGRFEDRQQASISFTTVGEDTPTTITLNYGNLSGGKNDPNYRPGRTYEIAITPVEE